MTVPADPRLGTRLAGYRIQSLLDRGGMGVVYLAEQLGPHRPVALKLLSAPVAAGEAFTEPASIREIADALVVSEAAVKQHLAHLYDKFGIHGGGERRRVRLANEALRRGAVTMAGLRQEVARDGKRPR